MCEISWTDKSADKGDAYLIQYVPIDDIETGDVIENKLYEKDACSQHVWINAVVKRENLTMENGKIKFNLTQLTQFTFYAFIVQEYEDETSETPKHFTSSSDAKFFKTEMQRPSRVTKFQTSVKNSDSITLEFDVVNNERNAINQFIIHVFERQVSTSQIDQRDYCLYPIRDQDDGEESEITIEILHQENCCKMCCDKNQEIKPKEVYNNFEKSLIQFSDIEQRKNFHEHLAKMQSMEGFLDSFYLEGYERMKTIENLKPFSFYTFHIYACAKGICSEYETHLDKTVHNENYDRINVLSFNVHDNKIIVDFEEPRMKNGAIVSYLVELREIIGNNSHLIHTQCITRALHEQRGFIFSYENLQAGQYSFRVLASSLAGHGPFTDFHYFKVSLSESKVSWNWIILGISTALILLVSISITYYYKHKIITMMRHHDDSTVLMKDVEPMDFYKVSLHHSDKLSDIIENDDDEG